MTDGRGASSIHVVRGPLDIEDGVTEPQELRSLERLGEEIRQHVLCGAVDLDNLGLLLGHDIGNEKISDLDVARLLATRRPSVDLELDRALIFLVNQRRAHSMCRAVGVDLVLVGRRVHASLPKRQHGAGVALHVFMDGERRVHVHVPLESIQLVALESKDEILGGLGVPEHAPEPLGYLSIPPAVLNAIDKLNVN